MKSVKKEYLFEVQYQVRKGVFSDINAALLEAAEINENIEAVKNKEIMALIDDGIDHPDITIEEAYKKIRNVYKYYIKSKDKVLIELVIRLKWIQRTSTPSNLKVIYIDYNMNGTQVSFKMQ